MSWWRRPRLRGRAEAELDAELRDHVERQVADYVRGGMSAPEARRRTRLEFGGLDQVKELCRDARGRRWIENISRDLRYAFRRLARDRSLVTLAVTTLGLGIGLNVAVFAMVHAIFVRGLPYDDPGRIVNVWSSSDRSSRSSMDGSNPASMTSWSYWPVLGAHRGALKAYHTRDLQLRQAVA